MKSCNVSMISHHALWIGTSVGVLLLVLTLVLGAQVGATPNQQLPDGTPVFLPIVVKSGGPPPTPCVPSAVGTVAVGQDPYGSASDEVDEVFVANHAAGTVSVLQGIAVVDLITDTVLSEPYDVAYNPANNRIYVTDEATGELVIIDPQSHAILKRLGGLDHPRGIGIDRNTGTAYVASPGTEGVGAVRAYSLTDVENNLEGTLITSVGVGPSWVAVNSETHTAYVTLQGEMNNGLAVIDGAGGGYGVTYVGLNTPGAFGVAYNPDNQRLYVASGTASILSVVDVTKIGSPGNPVIAGVKTNPEYSLDTVAVNPTTGHVFVTGRRELNAKVWVLDGSTNTWLDDPFNVGSYNPEDPFLRGVSFDPVQGWFYVSSDFTDQVYVFDDCGEPPPPPTPCVPSAVGTVAVGQDPYGSASDETDEVFVANHAAGAVSVLQGIAVVDLITDTVLSQPYDVAYNPANNRIYVTDEATGELVIIDPQSHAILKRLGGLDHPRGIGIDRNTGTAYVASPGTEGVGAVRAYSLTDVENNLEGTLITSVGVGPSWVAVNSETHTAYVTLQGEMNNGLAVIDGAGGGYGVTYVGLNTPGAFGVAYNPDNQRLYVASGTASILSVVDVTKIGSPGNPVIAGVKTNPEYSLDTVAVNPTTGHVFVTGRRELNAKVWVLDGSTNTWLDDPFNVGSYNPDAPFLRGVSFDPVQGWFYVSSDFTDQVYVFDDCGD